MAFEKRGNPPTEGSWISVVEAKEISGEGIEWVGHDNGGVWKYSNDDMYDGPWRGSATRRKHIVEHGKGLYYNAVPPNCNGLCYDGDWDNGLAHGHGRSFWLPGSHTWQQNKRVEVKHPFGGKPFQYVGTYERDQKHGKGDVTFKDGETIECGWKEDRLLGEGVFLRRPRPSSVAAPPKAPPAKRQKQPPKPAKKVTRRTRSSTTIDLTEEEESSTHRSSSSSCSSPAPAAPVSGPPPLSPLVAPATAEAAVPALSTAPSTESAKVEPAPAPVPPVERLAAAVVAPRAVAAGASNEKDNELEHRLKFLKRMLDEGTLTNTAYEQKVAKCLEHF